MDVKFKGQFHAGVNISWPNLDLLIDVLDPGNSYATGFTPQFDKTFKVEGELTASAFFGFLISATFGIDIFNGLFDLFVDLKDKSSIEFGATFNNPGCSGMKWAVTFHNDVNVVYPGGSDNFFDFSQKVDSGCIAVTKRDLEQETGMLAKRQKDLVLNIDPNNQTVSRCRNVVPNLNLNYTSIQDTTGKYILIAGADKNLYFGNTGANYPSAVTSWGYGGDNVIMGDSTRLFHWYP